MARLFPPKDEADWLALRAEMLEAFTPGAPIDEASLFAGRQEHLQRARDAVASRGRHAVVFGERGTGKTSLVNIFHVGHYRPRSVSFVYVQCSQDDTFDSLWRKALRRIVFRTETSEHLALDYLIGGEVTPDELEVVLANFPASTVPIIVFDEFDRIRDERCRAGMTEAIKQLSNAADTRVTIMLVGVANNVTQLIREHASIARALVQIRMPRMTRDELQQVVASRLKATPLAVTEEAMWRITYLSSGLPFYAHSLGQKSALLCIDRKTLRIDEATVRDAIEACFADVDQLLVDAYVQAIVETRKGNMFKWVLAACALAEQDEIGRFSAVDVATPLTAILGRDVDPTAFTFHLNELCASERGEILEREGARGRYRYRFVQPIIQPFIVMKSLASGLVDAALLDRFALERQRCLPLQ